MLSKKVIGEREMDNGESKRINSVRELKVYQLGFDTAMEIFDISKSFPSEEKYSLTDQIRRSSRSVCSNLAEAWRKRRYSAVFINNRTFAFASLRAFFAKQSFYNRLLRPKSGLAMTQKCSNAKLLKQYYQKYEGFRLVICH